MDSLSGVLSAVRARARARDVPKIRSSVKLVKLSASSSSVEGCLDVVKVLKSVHLVPRRFLVARSLLGYL